MSNSKQDNENSRILTIRIPESLKAKLQYIANERNMKISEIAKRYLYLSEVFIITDGYSKIDSDGQNLILYPDKLINEVFNLIARIPSKDRFTARIELGDKLGGYINSITYNMGIHKNNYYSIFKLIEKLGWFKLSYKKVSEDTSIILIPKTYGEKSLIYSMVHRIVKRVKYPDEWTEELINHVIPHPEGKLNRDQNRENEEFERQYEQYIKKTLEPDLEQEKLDHYYFESLKIQTPEF